MAAQLSLQRSDAVASFLTNGCAAFIKAIWRCRKPLNKWQRSFQMKAALPLANRLATTADRSDKTGPSATKAYFVIPRSPVISFLYVPGRCHACSANSHTGKKPSVVHHTLFPLILVCSLWCVQMFGYIMAWGSHSFVSTLDCFIIIIQIYLNALNI